MSTLNEQVAARIVAPPRVCIECGEPLPVDRVDMCNGCGEWAFADESWPGWTPKTDRDLHQGERA